MTKREKRLLTQWITYVLWQVSKFLTIVVVLLILVALYRDQKLTMSLKMQEIKELKPERLPLEYQIKLDMERMEVPSYLLEREVAVNTVNGNAPSEEEIWLLAQAMYAEEGVFFKFYDTNPLIVELVHKLAGSVILHRQEVGYLGATTIEEVIFSKGQYATQTQERVKEGQNIRDEVYIWAEELLTEGAIGPKGMIYQAEFDQGESYMFVGNQKFGVEPKYNN